MSGRLDGRVALITGGARGIGLGIARRFAAEGARLALVDVDRETLHAVASDLGANAAELRTYFTDVGERAALEATIASVIDDLGHLDVLVNNAYALGPMGPVEAKATEDFELAMRVCFYGTLWSMQAVFPHMRDRGWGRVVNLVSLAGVDSHPFEADYNAAKEAVRSITRSAAREWARHGICINAIAPFAASDAFERMAAAQPAAAAKLTGQVPVGRMGDPHDDIAPVALFLASDEARYVTGNVIYADGGAHINGVQWQ